MKVKCDRCGKIFEYTGGQAHFNRTKNHYCSLECAHNGKFETVHSNRNKLYVVYKEAKRRAKKKGIEFSIEMKDMPNFPEICPVLGIKISLTNTRHQDNSPSLDRIDNTKGYVPGNVVLVSNRANRLKSDASVSELYALARFYEKILGLERNKTNE